MNSWPMVQIIPTVKCNVLHVKSSHCSMGTQPFKAFVNIFLKGKKGTTFSPSLHGNVHHIQYLPSPSIPFTYIPTIFSPLSHPQRLPTLILCSPVIHPHYLFTTYSPSSSFHNFFYLHHIRSVPLTVTTCLIKHECNL